MPVQKWKTSEQNSIFRLKIYICNLKIRICSLKICIFNLKIEIFPYPFHFFFPAMDYLPNISYLWLP